MSYKEEIGGISWSKVREDFNASKETSERLTYVANNFMRKGLHDLRDLKGKKVSELKAKGIGKKGRAILVVLANYYCIPIRVSNEEIIAYEKDMYEAKKVLHLVEAK